jgi:2-haloacid dehalogenase
MTIKAVVFDAYGTLFDVYSIGALAEQLYPSHGTAVAALWRDKQIEYTRLTTMSDPHGATGSKYYQSFQELTRLALHYALERLQLAPEPAKIDALIQQYNRLPLFPENRAVLENLKADGIGCAILSNGNTDMLNSVVANAGMTDLLDHVISVDSVRLFKTAPESYSLVQQRIEVNKDEILFVSSNAWDVLGATWFGFQTLWINRQNMPFETIGPKPTYSGSDLTRVLGIVAS